PIGNLAGDVSTVQKGIAERSLAGGTISLASDGAALIQQGATLNVSGGTVTYASGYVGTSSVLGTDGRVYDIAQADPNRTYAGVVSSHSVEHAKWGVTETFPTYFSSDPIGHYETGYVEGKDAGSVNILAPRIALDGNIKADVTVGPHQPNAPTATIPSGLLYRPVD